MKNRQEGFGTRKVIVIVLIILVLGGALFAVLRRDKDDKPAVSQTSFSTEVKTTTMITPTDFNDPEGQRILTALKQENSSGAECIGEESPDRPFMTTEENIVAGIVFDTNKTRASAPFCGAHYFLGKQADGNWVTLLTTQASLSSAFVDACKFNDLVKKLDANSGGSLVDDNYTGGKDTDAYNENTAAIVQTCTDFVAANG